MNIPFFQSDVETASRILYTPSTFAKTNLLYLQEAGTLTAQRPHTSSRQGLASYLFFIVQAGSGSLEYDGKSYRPAKGDCVFLDCQKPYSHATDAGSLWALAWVHFYGPNMGAIYEKYVQRGGRPCFVTPNYGEYDTLLRQLYETAASSSYLRDMLIYEKLASLLTLLMEDSWNPGQHPGAPSSRRSLQDIKDYLDMHFQEKLSLDMLSERFYINKFYLARRFKEQFGISVTGYLSQMRVTHAKRLLRFSSDPIEVIARQCGIEDANYFTRLFHKIEGITPGEYRRQW